MNKKLYIILGQSNSRKSSVMRCLTGCTVVRGNWQIQFLNKQTETCFVSITSPQERGGEGVFVDLFIKELLEKKEVYLFITMQSKSTTKQPDGEYYLQAFINAGFDIQKIACFDENVNTTILPIQLFNTRDIPSNQTASEVRKLWEIV